MMTPWGLPSKKPEDFADYGEYLEYVHQWTEDMRLMEEESDLMYDDMIGLQTLLLGF